MKVGVFYGSNTGNTEEVIEVLDSTLQENGFEVSKYDMQSSSSKDFDSYDFMIMACPTWNDGELQDDFEDDANNIEKYDFTGKTVALVGLGDQETYSDTFVDAIGTLSEMCKKNGAKVIGSWPIEGYDFEESAAVIDGKFVGLALDEDNQSDMTSERISTWVNQLKEELK